MAALFELYRPTTFTGVVGQEAAVRQIQRVLARGWGGRAWFLTGPSGAGKTTLARIIAAQGADDLAIEEVDAQTLTPARLREIEGEMRYRHLGQKPGKAYLINEVHGLRKDTIRLLLVLLERLPEHVCWIFTTTKAGEQRLFEDDLSGDAAPLLSRCVEVSLVYDDATNRAFAERARAIAQREGIDGLPLSVYVNAVSASAGNFRRVLQRIESGTFRDDALAALEREYAMVKSTKGEHAEKRRAELQAAIAAAKKGL
jgi:DNA polymerase-3 subunit gamma/tau